MQVNGKEINLGCRQTLLEFLLEQGFECGRIAVERNGTIIPKSEYGSVYLLEEDTLEIVRFVGGG